MTLIYHTKGQSSRLHIRVFILVPHYGTTNHGPRYGTTNHVPRYGATHHTPHCVLRNNILHRSDKRNRCTPEV